MENIKKFDMGRQTQSSGNSIKIKKHPACLEESNPEPILTAEIIEQNRKDFAGRKPKTNGMPAIFDLL